MYVLVTGAYTLTEEELEILEAEGGEITYQQFETEQTVNAEKFELVICNNLFKHNDVRAFTGLKAIQLTSAGIDEKLAEYAEKNGILLFNARDVYSIPIAETAIMQILNIYRNSRQFIENQSGHVWNKERGLEELYGKNALIIGYGSIGAEIAKRLCAFGVKVTAANRTYVVSEYIDNYVPIRDIVSAAPTADIVVVSIAGAAETEGIISRKFLESMKRGSVFVNVSRGANVDETALIDELKKKRLCGAALDVMRVEPLPQDSELWDMKNVYITPHNAFIGSGTRKRLFDVIMRNLKSVKKELGMI